MEKLLTNKTVSLTELRDPAKVFKQAGNTPVAILNRNALVGYFVPKSAVQPQFETSSTIEVLQVLDETRKADQSVLGLFKGQVVVKLLSTEAIALIHSQIINENELQGLAGNKSLDATVNRVFNRIQYGMIEDAYNLAATYAVVLAVGHVFNDANKRTAFKAMNVCLRLNGISLNFQTEEIGRIIVEVSQGLVDETELSDYLRTLA